jgi:hypothetical protein
VADRIDRTILDIEAGPNAKKAARTVAQLTAELADLKDEQRALQRSFRQGEIGAAKVGDAFERVENKTRQLAAAQRDYRDEIDGTASASRRAADQVERLAQRRTQIRQADLAGDVESRTRAITGAVGFVGGARGAQFEQTANIGAELLAAGEGLTKLKQELPAFIQGLSGMRNQLLLLGGVGGALALGGFLLNERNKALERERERLEAVRRATEAYINELLDFNRFVLGASTEEAQARIRELQDERNALEVTRAEIRTGLAESRADIQQRLAEQIPETFAENQELFNFITDIIEGTARIGERADLADPRDIQRVVDEFEAGTAQYQEEFAELTGLIIDASEELAEIESRFPDVTGFFRDAEAATVGLGVAFEAFTAQENELSAAVTDATHERERELERQRAIRAAELAIIEEQTTKLEALEVAREEEAKAAELQAGVLSSVVSDALAESVATLAEREREATEEQADALLKRTRALEDHYADLADADAKFYAKRGDVLRDIASDLADIDADRLNELEEHNRDSQRASRDHLRTLERIRRDSERDETDAASRMDASAILDIRRQREQAIEDAQDQYSEEQEIRGEDFQQRLEELDDLKRERQQDGRAQLTELDRQHRDEQQRRVAAFALKQRREDEDRRITLQRQQAAWMREDAARRAHLAAQLGVTETHFDQMLILAQSGMAQFRQAIFKELSVADPAQKGSTYINPKAPRPFKAFANGGFAAAGTTALVGERGPEFVRFMQPAQVYPNGSGGGGLSVQSLAINIHDARDPERVAQTVRAELLELLA